MKPTALLIALLTAAPLLAGEGKWTPQQVVELGPAWLAEQGLELPPERLWDPARGTGLLAATISLGNCSAGWISADGLFITNHHCLFGLLQEHATPDNDIIAKGFLAPSRDEELRGRTARVTIPRAFRDVTADVLAAVPEGADDRTRHRSIERKENEIVAACEAKPRTRCKVAAHDGGVQYVLQEMEEIDDVRLVWAPPRAIGEFGGEVDNWTWPRHTGDFAIGRAWVDGKPYRPEFWFPLSTRGVDEGDFVMVLGYPGTTYRALTAPEMEERLGWFGARAEVYREWITVLESASADPAGAIAVADTLKTLRNRQKNAEGQIAGFQRGNLLAKKQAADEVVLATANPAAREAYEALRRLAAEKTASAERDFLLDHVRVVSPTSLPTGPPALVLAAAVARTAALRPRPDAERESPWTDRNFPRLVERLAREQKSLHAPADKAILASFVDRAHALPEGQRIAAIDAVFPPGSTPAEIDRRIDDLHARTRLLDGTERAKMLGETEAQLRARGDALVDLGFALQADLDELVARTERWAGAISRLRPVWRRAVVAHAGRPVAPDGNSTLRVSFAHVRGYVPRDGVVYTPQTTLSGLVAKHTGEDPFDVPDPVLAAAREGRLGRFADAELGDVPVAFLADGDTTGGNSGSPAVNGRGELVGVNFDRVWENVANDFGYNPDIARQISADMRYMLWLLEEVHGATSLLQELGVAPASER